MKNLLFIVSLLPLTTLAAPKEPCAANYVSNSDFIELALDANQEATDVASVFVTPRKSDTAMRAVSITLKLTDGRLVKFAGEQDCRTGVPGVKILSGAESQYVCKEAIDCSLKVGETSPFCTGEYFDWSKASCSTQPFVVR